MNSAELLESLATLARQAGAVVMSVYATDFAVRGKGDASPVTEADERAEAVILAGLAQLAPEIPVVAEESMAAGRTPDVSGGRFWLVDPLDGTKEFIGGSPDYTVNIALIKNHVPVLGVIYAPARGEMYAAYGEGTAVRWLQDTNNEKPIRTRVPPRGGLTVMASKSRSIAELDKFLEEHKVEKIIRKGSSLKICAIASGKADLYPGLAETCEWDTAAGQAILESAGGEIVDLDGKPLRYGTKAGDFKNPRFIAQAKF